MQIQENVSLKDYNTFGIDVTARYFISVSKPEEVKKVLDLKGYPELFLLGGGSNMLLTQDLERLVVHLNLKGISVQEKGNDKVWITAMAGENWHDFTQWALAQDYGGIENLSLIPGNIGTAPIQNIGAYGVELKDVFVSCTVMDRATGEIRTLTKSDCQFGYRDSLFKKEAKDQYIILSVCLELTQKNHRKHTTYGAISAALRARNIDNPSIQDVAEAVIGIRRQKLPDPKEIGNSGSFFKNPILSKTEFEQFSKQHTAAPFYALDDGNYKIPAGWLIEASGLKGFTKGKAGVHKNQALVLVNYGGATGNDIWEMAQYVQHTVIEKFGIKLVPEVNIIP
ncbi:UDP-N-acetylmuramate dehydrogenase [Sediminicola luteus]|uniref:UDP-N-acetylenolpyruvoylglucosamine reductase n=1 Tax=Sediminicola luteus TaxID=319238 RepID=A0A2A4G473_9FLAO|nr:UDP-N-acetylmuramate dehydrogenase [Sediminicola luteus]PCE63467.1 UDP-N-acetylenolpyruvoylglucosamine reductase [Sediminicola luteus]